VGENTSKALLGTSVLTPTMRYHPSIVAQSDVLPKLHDRFGAATEAGAGATAG
jgi:hypothetical protein